MSFMHVKYRVKSIFRLLFFARAMMTSLRDQALGDTRKNFQLRPNPIFNMKIYLTTNNISTSVIATTITPLRTKMAQSSCKV